MEKSLDRKLAAIHADPNAPRVHPRRRQGRRHGLRHRRPGPLARGASRRGPVPRRSTSTATRCAQIIRQGLVDIMLMSASTNEVLTIHERLFDDSPVTPAVRANDTTDIHIVRGSALRRRSRRGRSAPRRSTTSSAATSTARPRSGPWAPNLGLYSVTFNNDLALDLATLEQYKEFRVEAERKGFRHFLEVFDPNVPERRRPRHAARLHQRHDRPDARRRRPGRAGRVFLKIVYHGPKAMEELVRYDPHLVVGILGGSAGTTYDAFKLLAEAKKYGARVALFGRKINNAENQLAFVQFLRLIADGEIGPDEAVKAYHAVLGKLGIRPHRPLEDDLKLQTAVMSYGGSSTSVTVPPKSQASAPAAPQPAAAHACQCHAHAPSPAGAKSNLDVRSGGASSNGNGTYSTNGKHSTNGFPTTADGRPDFGRMDVAQRLTYHRERLGLGR